MRERPLTHRSRRKALRPGGSDVLGTRLATPHGNPLRVASGRMQRLGLRNPLPLSLPRIGDPAELGALDLAVRQVPAARKVCVAGIRDDDGVARPADPGGARHGVTAHDAGSRPVRRATAPCPDKQITPLTSHVSHWLPAFLSPIPCGDTSAAAASGRVSLAADGREESVPGVLELHNPCASSPATTSSYEMPSAESCWADAITGPNNPTGEDGDETPYRPSTARPYRSSGVRCQGAGVPRRASGPAVRSPGDDAA